MTAPTVGRNPSLSVLHSTRSGNMRSGTLERMSSARNPDDFLSDITVPFDGIDEVRKAKLWSRDKLGILAMYLPAFASACHEKAPDFYFVDGLAGPGLYYFEATKAWVLGSTLLALRATPPFAKVVSMELSKAKARALTRRTDSVRERSIVEPGDCNRDLIPLMEREIPKAAPVVVFLDPEGLELEWHTVVKMSEFRRGNRKVELLILVPTGSIGRSAEVEEDYETHGATKTDFMFPNHSSWRRAWAARKGDELTPEGFREALAEDYKQGLSDLGYRHVETRAITHGGRDDASVYHLVFATDHEAGQRIMEHVFSKMYSTKRGVRRDQGTLPGF